ncbi:aspartate aminotransferase family protein [Nocardiopsis sp. ATB16-24]|uniref:aspartate aminotransferase family protein n=1 Tax=Nocardiopsis sp. ATB16-24 TaxID=3019555 RepID=UPI0025549D47|nr:aspartate aminotransferase family protein [Nocardiopsis sp. ATB16-24]
MAELSPILKQATPVVAARGEGAYIYDEDDRRYLDFTAGIGVTSTGHCHPRVVAAAQEQVATLIHGQYTTVMHRPLLRLTERLGEVLPQGLDRLFYVNSGSEAVEAALRLSRQATGRQNVIVLQGSFHGRTMGAASLTTSGVRLRAGIGPLMPGVVVSPFPHAYRLGMSEADAVAYALRELDYLFSTVTSPRDTAAVFVEPVLGEGGYVPVPDAFFQGLRERADQHGFLLVADEVQTGFGRTGTFWGHEPSGVRPDVVITAKGLASGFPLSAIAAPASIMEKAWPGSQGGTYGGNAVSCAAALATLDVIQEEGLVENAARMGERLRQGLERVAKANPVIGDVRGRGLMIGSEFTAADGTADGATAQRAQQAAVKNGLLLLTCAPEANVVRMIPPLIVTEDQVDDAVSLWEASVKEAVS